MSSKVRVISPDGSPESTKVFLPDGTEIGQHACAISVVMTPAEPSTVTLTFMLASLDIGGDDPLTDSPEGTLDEHPAITAHKRSRLSG